MSGPASTRMSAFIGLKTSTINKQDIKTNSPIKTYLAEWKSLIELEIINKKPIPKFLAQQHQGSLIDTAMFLL